MVPSFPFYQAEEKELENHAVLACSADPGALDVEAVQKEAVQDGLPDLVVVVGLGRYLQGPGAEGLAAAAARLVLCVVDVEPGFLAVGQGADLAAQAADATAGLATAGAGAALGGATD